MLRINLTLAIEIGEQPLTRQSWARRAEQVKNRDGATCRYCGQPAPDGQVDHVIPLSRGGTDDLSNLAWACRSCNASKGSKTPQEWGAGEQGTDLPAPNYTLRPSREGDVIDVG